MEGSCGLITLQQEPAALKNFSVTLSIHEFVASVSPNLNCENEEKVPLEASFMYPMDEDFDVFSFEDLVDGKKIVAELQDKMEAQHSYEDAISQGQEAYLLEEDSYSRDVFCCNVGNLQPGSKVEFTLRKSVNSTQKTMEEVVKRIKLMSKDLGGTEILAPLQNIYRKPSITGHPLRLFVFTDGEVAETFSVI
ncbi:Hypothetical predicted protein [Marmota monax]|uniref:VIT domain-containing protein n=1 Tax=Marmota monax TaxID=9995 RepID=A0A5E4CW27_MARMO|nr:Hypothetical predicted protein [Marmota monax]